MGNEYKTNPIESRDDKKSLEQMVESIKINYAIKLLLKFGKSQPG